MPSINLRLSDTELVLLRDWAHDSRRSLQKEVVYRLFSGLTEREVVGVVAENSPTAERAQKAEGSDSRTPDLNASRSVSPDDVVTSSAGFITPQGREEAARVMTGKRDLIETFPKTAPRGVCSMSVPRGTKCKVCGKVHPL